MLPNTAKIAVNVQQLIMPKRKQKLVAFSLLPLLIIVIVIIFLFYSTKNSSEENSNPDVQGSFTELNTYLKSQNQPEVPLKNIKQISNYDLYDSLQNDEKITIVDIREAYELEISKLPTDFDIKYIRLGDIISNNFKLADINSPIVIISFGKNRAYQAALYLQSKGYSNISVLEGGISKWAMDNFPMEINNYQKDKEISKTLEYIDPSGERIKSAKIIHFGPLSDPKNIQSVYWSSKSFDDYLSALSPGDAYIISCNNRKDCYNGIFFWHKAKSRINIVGYTQNI